MATSKAHQKATAKYNAKAYESIMIRVKKGRKAEIQAHAEKVGESINSFVNRAIDEAIDHDCN